MNLDKRTARMYGVLLILGIVFGIINSVPALEYPDYMTKLSSMESRVLMAVFFQAAMAVVYVLVAAILHPIIKNYDERLASGYFGFRIIGAGFLFIGIVSLLLLLWLSQSFVSAGMVDATYLQTLGDLIRQSRDHLNHIGMILPWSIGGLILYYCFYKMMLIPRWLSIWGILSTALTLFSTLLLMLRIIEMATPLYLIINTPAALFELFLAVYLLIKGFDINNKKSNQGDQLRTGL